MSCKIKTVILGESATGKSSIAYRLAKNKFNRNMESTIGASFLTITDGNIQYDIWDTAGQEKYLALVPLYYKNSDVILLVFDMENLKTIDRFIFYLDKIINELTKQYRILIVGNKCDLIDTSQIDKVDKVDIYVKKKLEPYKKLINELSFVYVSAKTGYNFDILVEKIKQFGIELKDIKLADNQIKGIINLTPENNNMKTTTSSTTSTSITETVTSTVTSTANSLITTGSEYCAC